MYHEIIAQYHFLTLWERFVTGLVDEQFGDYLATRLDVTHLHEDQEERTLWAIAYLHHCGWQACQPGQNLDVILPEPMVVDPFGNPYSPAQTIFIGFKGYPDLPGIPFPARLLFELLSYPPPVTFPMTAGDEEPAS